jgi:hypothetical protein
MMPAMGLFSRLQPLKGYRLLRRLLVEALCGWLDADYPDVGGW